MTQLALLFDLDGTLIDSIELLLDCMNAAFSGRSRAPTRDQWVAGIGTPLRAQLAEWATDEADVEMLVRRYREYQDVHLESLTTAYPGVPELITWLRGEGHATALVTSKGKIMTARSLAHVGLADAFDAIVTYEDTDRHKPLADPVLLALTKLGIPPDRGLFVGDSPHDMYSGLAAGVRTGAATWGPFSHDQLAPSTPTYWLSGVADLYGIVRDLSAGS